MHDEIIKFHLDGTIGDGNIVEQRERLIHSLEGQMRDFGAVPVLDLDPQFTLDYKPESETYNFSLSVYGTYVGGNESWQTAGVTSGTTISRYTPPNKSRESSTTSE
jgi:hypothetical protein